MTTARPRFCAVVGLEQFSSRLWAGVRETLAEEIELSQWSDVDLENHNPAAADDHDHLSHRQPCRQVLDDRILHRESGHGQDHQQGRMGVGHGVRAFDAT